jgi:uncharacterized membrane protein YozB (DUF420 family)
MTDGKARFAPWHRSDRNFFLLMVAIIWLGILMGFVPEIIKHTAGNKQPFPLIVHLHGVAFVAWLSLLTAQVWLIRSRKVEVHRKLGIASVVLAPLMIVLGLATAYTMDRVHFGTPQSDPAFLSIQLADLLNFGVLAGAAILFRQKSSAHKRLILLATIFICDAGFARWWGEALEKLLGDGFWQDWVQDYLSDFLLVAALGAYDLITRRRLHPAYVAGAIFGLGVELIAVWLYVSPWWKPIATKLIGH